MTAIAALFAALFFAGNPQEADPEPTQDLLIRKRSEKLQAGFFRLADWTTDYDEALARARKSGKLIFTYFTRSFPP